MSKLNLTLLAAGSTVLVFFSQNERAAEDLLLGWCWPWALCTLSFPQARVPRSAKIGGVLGVAFAVVALQSALSAWFTVGFTTGLMLLPEPQE